MIHRADPSESLASSSLGWAAVSTVGDGHQFYSSAGHVARRDIAGSSLDWRGERISRSVTRGGATANQSEPWHPQDLRG